MSGEVSRLNILDDHTDIYSHVLDSIFSTMSAKLLKSV